MTACYKLVIVLNYPHSYFLSIFFFYSQYQDHRSQNKSIWTRVTRLQRHLIHHSNVRLHACNNIILHWTIFAAMQLSYFKYSPGQVCFLQALLSCENPLQLLPNMHLLSRVSAPCPHVTEQVQLDQDDQATKTD